MVCLALEIVGSWVELQFQWRLLDELLSINVPRSEEFSGVPWFWSNFELPVY